ncbi:hypothetical protein ACFV0T_40280 [Streptomyces sp. NPDC059582]|uniref:hypothetical protein n=1 Tax=Streptomyces sp. NPDC059582 TaxID=3346875 RepID=UPI0036887978
MSCATISRHEAWLVGLQTRTTTLRDVWLYYVVDQASNACHAVSLALLRANSPSERATREGTLTEDGQVEVHQIRQDPIGRISLVRYA